MNQRKIDSLRDWFKSIPGTITAFSGGVDSSLVLYLSKKFLPHSSVACISASESLKRKDYDLAVDFCSQYGIPLEVIETKELQDTSYNSNPSNRCFYCKNHLYHDLQQLKEKFPTYVILNGTNKDDYKDYRPGIKAARKYDIGSPLADCGLNKQDVRNMAKDFGLPNWDKPASPCLSSRVPYGNLITEKKLRQIEAAEGILNDFGFEDVRVRHFEREASIEVPFYMMEKLKNEFDMIAESIKKLGFQDCIIDEEGLVSGKLNRNLKGNGSI